MPRRWSRATRPTGELPIAVLPDGAVLRNPTKQELARALGLVAGSFRAEPYDVAIVGAGPAGLATAVYGASEGLSILVLEQIRVRRTGRRQRAHRELPRLSHRRLGTGAHGACVHPGAEVRSRVQPLDRGETAGLHLGALGSGSGARPRARRRPAGPGAGGRRRDRRALPPSGDSESGAVRGPRRVVLGLARRGPAVPRTRTWPWWAAETRPDRPRCFSRARRATCPCWCAGPVSRAPCRAT